MNTAFVSYALVLLIGSIMLSSVLVPYTTHKLSRLHSHAMEHTHSLFALIGLHCRSQARGCQTHSLSISRHTFMQFCSPLPFLLPLALSAPSQLCSCTCPLNPTLIFFTHSFSHTLFRLFCMLTSSSFFLLSRSPQLSVACQQLSRSAFSSASHTLWWQLQADCGTSCKRYVNRGLGCVIERLNCFHAVVIRLIGHLELDQ